MPRGGGGHLPVVAARRPPPAPPRLPARHLRWGFLHLGRNSRSHQAPPGVPEGPCPDEWCPCPPQPRCARPCAGGSRGARPGTGGGTSGATSSRWVCWGRFPAQAVVGRRHYPGWTAGLRGACSPAPPPAPPGAPAVRPPPHPGSQPACRTEESRACVFPFTFRGQEHKACTRAHSVNGAPWCATLTSGGAAVRWGDCAPGCPVEAGGSTLGLCTGRCGVGRFILMQSDIFHETSSILVAFSPKELISTKK